MRDQNREATDHWVEMWSSGDFEAAAAWIAPEFYARTDANLPAEIQGHEQIKASLAGFRSVFPDARFTPEDEVSFGDKRAVRWIMTGTFSGEYLGIAPTGRAVTVNGVTILRFVDGKVAEQWVVGDWSALSR